VHTAESVTQRPHPTANAVARFDDGGAAAASLEVVGSGYPQGRRRRSTPMRWPQHSMCHGFRLLRISARNLPVSKFHGLSTTFRQSSSLFKNIS
jgi:hypothetical protein